MRKHFFLSAAAVWFTVLSTATALDSIKTKSGSMMGKIINQTPLAIVIEQGAAAERKEIPVNQIETIFYSEEPASLKNAKTSILAERYEDALNWLGRLKNNSIARKELLEDIEFYTAFCSAQLAKTGNGAIADAGRMMLAFLKNYPDSYHYFQSCEILGDLLTANRSYSQAEQYYAKLGKAPWPDYQMRAGVAVGRALLAQGKNDEAMRAFDKVLTSQSQDPLSLAQLQAAKLGKAAVLVAMKKNDDAIKLIDTVIRQANPDDTATLARAYNISGNALRQAGKSKEALMAFLHVDLLYSSVPDAHAEALYNLAELWDELHKTDRAIRARQILERDYKNGPWAQKMER